MTGCIATMPGGVAIRTWGEMAHQLDLLTDGEQSGSSQPDAGRKAARDIYHPHRTGRQLLEALITSGVGKSAGVNDE